MSGPRWDFILNSLPNVQLKLPCGKSICPRLVTLAKSDWTPVLVTSALSTCRIDLIESQLTRQQGQIVLHWFTGSKSEARRAVDLGCYFSINGAMLRNDRGRDLVAALPSDRLLTETDAPFTQFGTRATAPIDVKETVEALATLRNMTLEHVAQIIHSNLRALLEDAGVTTDP
jgi:Tat protein secretion system quality control protein TatD with DNase activity